jgi:integrase
VIHVERQLDRNLVLVEPKTESAKREVPLSPPLVALLKGLKADAFAARRAKPEDFVFVSEAGGPMHRRNMVRRGLEIGLEGSGLPHLSWHDLRHLAASMLIAEGTDVVALSRMLGHANPSITLSIFAHAFGRVQREELLRAQMGKAFAGVLG